MSWTLKNNEPKFKSNTEIYDLDDIGKEFRGVLQNYQVSYYPDEKIAYIDVIHVFDTYQNKGYGKKIVKYTEEKMRLIGAKEIRGESTEYSVDFWKALGYTVMKTKNKLNFYPMKKLLK